jgi:hypothetical protein
MLTNNSRAAHLRPLRFAVFCAAATLYCSAVQAQTGPSVALDDAQVQSFFDGVQQDQMLANQGQVFAPATPAPVVPPAIAPVERRAAAPAGSTAVADLGLGLDASGAMVVDEPPGPVETLLLMLATLAVLAGATTIVTLAVRHLRSESKKSKRTYRRRMHRRRHPPVTRTEATSH